MPQAKKPLSKLVGAIEGIPYVESTKNTVVKTIAEIQSILGIEPKKAYFVTSSTNTISINEDETNPSFITGLGSPFGFGFSLFDAATGAVRNDTGRVLSFVSGTISFNPNKSGGGTTTLELVSESSFDDGLNWTGNLNSRRTIEIPNNGETFQTKVSVAVNWQPNQLIRFRAYSSGGGGVDLESITSTILGQEFTTPSVVWELSEK